MNINTAYPSTYLKAAELEGDTVYTIKSVEIETLGKDENAEQKPIVYFNETDLGLALNKTNANTIQGLYGPETDEWVGKAITLFATEVDFQGKQTLAIRVRMKKPTGAAPAKPASNGADNHETVRRVFDEQVMKFNEDQPQHAYKPTEADEVFRKLMGELFPGKRPSTLTAAEWSQAKTSFATEFSPATRAFLPF
jgi:hypothetical protein